MRHFHQTVVYQDHQRFVHLNRRGGPVALADSDRDGVTLIPGLLKAFQLPFAGRHIPGTLFRQIDTGIVAVTEFAHPFREAVDPHIIGDLIEVGIRRLFERFGHIQVTVAPFFPVAVAFVRARQLPPTRVEQAGIAGDDVRAEGRYGDIRLHRRRRRVDPLSRAVDQRSIRIVQQGGVVFTGDAVHKQVRVVARRGDQREDAAGTRVGDDHGSAAAGEQGLNVLLKFEIEGQIDIAPGLRRHLFELANDAAAVVDLNLFIAGLTVQYVFVIALDSQLANIMRGGIVGQLALFIQAIDVFIVNF